MKIKELKVSRAWDGSPVLQITLDKAENNAVEQLLQISDTDLPKYDLTIEKRKKKRSLDANALFWKMIGLLSDKLKVKNTEIYKEYIKETSAFEIVPVKEDKIEHWERIWGSHGIGWICEDLGECRNTKGYHNIKSYYGTSVYDSKQMSIIIDMVIADCKENGIPTDSQDEIERIKQLWKCGNQ